MGSKLQTSSLRNKIFQKKEHDKIKSQPEKCNFQKQKNSCTKVQQKSCIVAGVRYNLKKLFCISKTRGKCEEIKMQLNIMQKLEKKFCVKIFAERLNLALVSKSPDA